MTAQVGAARPDRALQLRRRLAATGGVGHRPVRPHRRRRDRDDGAAVGHLARSVRARVHADALAVHDGHRRRQRAGVGRGLHARRAARRRRRSTTCGCGCSTTNCATAACSGSGSTARSCASTQFAHDRRPHGARRRAAASISSNDVVTLRANGDANLAVLQGVLPRGARLRPGRAVGARSAAPPRRRRCRATRSLTDGRLRSFAFPHALDAINGIVTFDASAVRLDGLRGAGWPTARVQFGGRIGLRGLALADYDVTLTGHDLRLRYPEGMRSLVDAALTVQGPAEAPVLGGSVLVRIAVWTPAFDGTTNVFGVDAGAGRGGRVQAWPAPPAAPAAPALRFDVRLRGAVDLPHRERPGAASSPAPTSTLRGTVRAAAGVRPRRRRARRGDASRAAATSSSRGSLDFTNPDRIQPFFDVEAETRVRVPGADLPGHAARRRHHRTAAARVHLRSAAAVGRRAVAAARRHARRPATSR